MFLIIIVSQMHQIISFIQNSIKNLSMRIDKNLVVIVTGGSSGLGLATVRLLRQKGAQVVCADINEKLGNQVAEQTKCDFFKVDVADQKNVIDLINFTVKRYGKIDVVLNSAGIFIPTLTLSDDKVVGSTESLLTILKINLIGSWNVAKHAAKQMASQAEVNGQRGLIINLSSNLGEQGKSYTVVYSATKGAIDAMTLPMARELGSKKIRVMTIAPGLFDTPINANMPPELKKSLLTIGIPLGIEGQPAWFALCVRDIIENPYASGSVWRLDGGIRVPNL